MMVDKNNDKLSVTRAGDLVQLVGLSHKSFLFILEPDGVFHTHRGILYHNELLGKTWGTQIYSHTGSPFYILQPTLTDILRNTKRATQIMYPKEIGYVLLYMGISPGKNVIEAGTGSGSLTTAMAYAVGEAGRIYSYEANAATQLIAKKTIDRLSLGGRVDFKQRDIREGFDERNVDVIFLDVANPYDYLSQVRQALKPGGHFGCILPTTNQVISMLTALRQNEFAFIEVCDISIRFYKTEPTRFRPADRMIAHTGYLVFARPIFVDRITTDLKLLEEIGLVGLGDQTGDEGFEVEE